MLLHLRTTRRRVAVASLAAGAVLTSGFITAAAADADSPRDSAKQLRKAATLQGARTHARALQKISDATGGNRAAGSDGYAASAGYIAGQLTAAGYDVDLQSFDFPFFAETAEPEMEQVSPDPTTYTPGEDFATMVYSGSGDVTAQVQAVDVTLPPDDEPNSSTSGCEVEDFDGFEAGNIALIQRGTCTFLLKADNAENAGATAVIIFNEGQEGRTDAVAGTLGEPLVDIPVVGASFAVGADLADPNDTVARVFTQTVAETRSTFNVIAETEEGRDGNVVMLGAHLDSVTAGPGIVDNGSGSAALLEVAEKMAEAVPNPKNKVRFAWWSAEEFGLLGSEAYVSSRSQTELGSIAMYLNFDMIASQNFVRFIYDGDDSDGEGAGPGPEGSAAIEKRFQKFFARRDLATKGTDFSGRSDYGPFIAVGIPSGGLFTGAEGIKTEEEAEVYGGEAGVAYEPCYHAACDTLRQVNNKVFRQNLNAIASVTGFYAQNTKSVNDLRVAERTPLTKKVARQLDNHLTQ